MYAVIETGGKQYRVEKGDVLTVEKLNVEAGEKVSFDKVLVVGDEKGISIGKPYLEGQTVEAKVVENGKAKKVVIFKYKNKKDYRKKQGHRQPYTMVEIQGIGGATTAKAEKSAEKTEKAVKAVKAEKTVKEVKASKTKKVSASMKKDELIAYAKENNIKIDAKATKAVIIETIENAEA